MCEFLSVPRHPTGSHPPDTVRWQERRDQAGGHQGGPCRELCESLLRGCCVAAVWLMCGCCVTAVWLLLYSFKIVARFNRKVQPIAPINLSRSKHCLYSSFPYSSVYFLPLELMSPKRILTFALLSLTHGNFFRPMCW